MNHIGFGQSSFALKAIGFTNKANSDDAILALFAGGKQGVWYDPSDKSTLFQDVAGTVPVTKDGDPVALMRDKSGNGNHATQTVSAARPVYKTDGILHWLAFDGTDDSFVLSRTALLADKSQSIFSAYSLNAISSFASIFSAIGAGEGITQFYSAQTANRRAAIATKTSLALVIVANLPTLLKTKVVRTTLFNRKDGRLTDTENRGGEASGSLALNSDIALPVNGYSIGKASGAAYANISLYGLIVVSGDLSVSDVYSAESALANKSGVTL